MTPSRPTWSAIRKIAWRAIRFVVFGVGGLLLTISAFGVLLDCALSGSQSAEGFVRPLLAFPALLVGVAMMLFGVGILDKQTQVTPTLPSITVGRRRVIVLASLASAICLLTATWMSNSGPGEQLEGTLILSPFWLPYVLIPFRLLGEKIKSGLTLAAAMGSALFLPGIALIYYVHEWQLNWWIQGSLVLALVLQPILVSAAVRAYKSLPSEPRDRSKLAVSGAYGVLLFGLFWFTAIFGNFPSPIAYNESRAVEAMDIIYTSADSYAKKHQGFFPDNLSNSPKDQKVECENDRPRLYQHEEKYGYLINYQVVTAGKLTEGCRMAVSFTGTARPVSYGKTGIRSFFVDQTLVIRFTSENRAATASDLKLPASGAHPL